MSLWTFSKAAFGGHIPLKSLRASAPRTHNFPSKTIGVRKRCRQGVVHLSFLFPSLIHWLVSTVVLSASSTQCLSQCPILLSLHKTYTWNVSFRKVVDTPCGVQNRVVHSHRATKTTVYRSGMLVVSGQVAHSTFFSTYVLAQNIHFIGTWQIFLTNSLLPFHLTSNTKSTSNPTLILLVVLLCLVQTWKCQSKFLLPRPLKKNDTDLRLCEVLATTSSPHIPQKARF